MLHNHMKMGNSDLINCSISNGPDCTVPPLVSARGYNAIYCF